VEALSSHPLRNNNRRVVVGGEGTAAVGVATTRIGLLRLVGMAAGMIGLSCRRMRRGQAGIWNFIPPILTIQTAGEAAPGAGLLVAYRVDQGRAVYRVVHV